MMQPHYGVLVQVKDEEIADMADSIDEEVDALDAEAAAIPGGLEDDGSRVFGTLLTGVSSAQRQGTSQPYLVSGSVGGMLYTMGPWASFLQGWKSMEKPPVFSSVLPPCKHSVLAKAWVLAGKAQNGV